MNHVTRNNILFIDTSDFESAQLALVSGGVVWHKFAGRNLSENLLLEIKKFSKKNKISLRQITKIAVIVGPGWA